MRLGITSKLFTAILVTNVIIVVAFGAAVQGSVGRNFREYVQNRELRRLQDLGRSFEAAYVEHGNWDFVRDDINQWRRLARSDHARGRRGPRRDVVASNDIERMDRGDRPEPRDHRFGP